MVTYTNGGSLIYFQEQMNKQSYNEKSDIWSLGCVLYEMCTLRPPFLACNQKELAVKIGMGLYSKIPYRYSSGLDQLIKKMLSVEVRLPASSYVKRLNSDDFILNSFLFQWVQFCLENFYMPISTIVVMQVGEGIVLWSRICLKIYFI